MPTGIMFSLFRSSIRMFVRSLVRSFVRYSGTFVEFMSKFLLKFLFRGQNLGHLLFGSKFWFKFLWWCISHEPMIRNHSYFNRRSPIGFALFL